MAYFRQGWPKASAKLGSGSGWDPRTLLYRVAAVGCYGGPETLGACFGKPHRDGRAGLLGASAAGAQAAEAVAGSMGFQSSVSIRWLWLV
ncbi:hypothetical protein NH8B_3965 [Pseudogulbenkiania sp. NH8B]|nr:hypothetical protein NH8B_3965 [Pseudogulbenkiania sp. NH8B]